jgi:hypothetical protein
VSGCRVARTYVLDCYVQGVSIEFQLYKCIVASFDIVACWRSIMSESNDSDDSAEFVYETKNEHGTELDKTDSEDGRTKEKACNLISPQSNERDNALDPGTVGERAKMTDVYCIQNSVSDNLYGRISAV